MKDAYELRMKNHKVEGEKEMVNNDRKNCLTRIITKMARDEIQKGAVVGMYLNAFTEDDEKTIKIVSVVDEFTEAWENFKKEQVL